MSLNEHLGALWDRLLIIIALVVIGTAAGYAVAQAQEPAYQSRTLIALGPKASASTTLSSATQALYDRSVPSTLAQVATSSSIVGYAAQTTGVDATALAVKAAVANDANAVEVSVTGPDPQDTRRVAMSVASQAMLRFNQLYPLFRTVNIGPAAPGEETTIPPLVGGAAGGLLGLFLGSLIALGLGRRHRPLVVVPHASARAV